MKVTLGSIEVEVPGPVDAAAAQRAAAEVNRRLKEAEASSTRIDTIGFALRAAHSLAMDLEQVRQERDADAAEMARALHRIADTLKELIEDLEPAE